jgi:hypothetical protein
MGKQEHDLLNRFLNKNLNVFERMFKLSTCFSPKFMKKLMTT